MEEEGQPEMDTLLELAFLSVLDQNKSKHSPPLPLMGKFEGPICTG